MSNTSVGKRGGGTQHSFIPLLCNTFDIKVTLSYVSSTENAIPFKFPKKCLAQIFRPKKGPLGNFYGTPKNPLNINLKLTEKGHYCDLVGIFWNALLTKSKLNLYFNS